MARQTPIDQSRPAAQVSNFVQFVARLDPMLVTLIERLAMFTSEQYRAKANEYIELQKTANGPNEVWPAPGSEDTELGVLMEPEVDHGETEVYARVQA